MARQTAKVQDASLHGLKVRAGYEIAKLIRQKLDSHGTEFLDALREIALDQAVPPNVRVVALIHLLDRQVGKPPESISIEHHHEMKAMVANITPELQSKMTEVITALRAAKNPQ
jgi:hypothetical protein